MLNAPNTISVFRLLLVPVVIYLLTLSSYAYALVVLLLASISDGLDGWIARHFDLRTSLGALLDPLADKLIIVTCLLMLTWQGWIPLWLTLSMLARDIVIVAGAIAYRRLTGSLDITPTLLGKTHIALEFGLLCVVLANAASLVFVTPWLPGLFVLMFVTALLSGVQYVWIWGRKTSGFIAGKPR